MCTCANVTLLANNLVLDYVTGQVPMQFMWNMYLSIYIYIYIYIFFLYVYIYLYTYILWSTIDVDISGGARTRHACLL